MKKIRIKLFGKIFIYTLLFLSVVITVFTFFYAKQLETAFTLYERRKLTDDIQTLLGSLGGKTPAQKIEAIADFGIQNETFAFSVRTGTGEVLYETLDFTMSETTLKDLLKNDGIVAKNLREYDFMFSLFLDDNVTLYVARYAKEADTKDGLDSILPLSLILLGVSIVGAFIFAGLMSKPIKKLAKDTVKMSKLESVETPPPPSDEFGLLADNVHLMYKHLKTTIMQPENEIKLSKESEEKQRYFFGAASHELKTPVTAIAAVMEGLIGKVIEPDDYPEYFRKCLQLTKNQAKLVSEILDIVRLDEGRIAPKNEPVNLLSLLRSVMPSCQALSETKNQNIKISPDDDLICIVDKHMLSRVLSNVIMNAVQNTPEGGEIRIWSEDVIIETGKNRIKLCILNTNAHIDESVIAKIYEPFYRTDKSRSRSGGSSGLGLTIVKKSPDIMEIPFAVENRDGDVLFWLKL